MSTALQYKHPVRWHGVSRLDPEIVVSLFEGAVICFFRWSWPPCSVTGIALHGAARDRLRRDGDGVAVGKCCRFIFDLFRPSCPVTATGHGPRFVFIIAIVEAEVFERTVADLDFFQKWSY